MVPNWVWIAIIVLGVIVKTIQGGIGWKKLMDSKHYKDTSN